MVTLEELANEYAQILTALQSKKFTLGAFLSKLMKVKCKSFWCLEKQPFFHTFAVYCPILQATPSHVFDFDQQARTKNPDL